ncbi:hypothetical protein K501DRAFT_299501 [Backusella circina FSU 941]|nr:hypothetical protein K501DRAFT_299501 [Backusella circina FSU 941]
MQFSWFLALYKYLKDGSYPGNIGKVIKQKIRRHAANERLVLHGGNEQGILKQLHEEGHLGTRNLNKAIVTHFAKEILRARPEFTRTNPLKPIKTPTVDAIGPLEPTSRGNRWPIARAFYEECLVGCNFISDYTGIHTTAYRPQCNAACERLNQTLTRTIAKLAADENDIHEWDKYLNPALMSTGYSPTTWQSPIVDYVEGEFEVDLAKRVKYVEEDLTRIRKEARMNSDVAKQRSAIRYDKTVHQRPAFKTGEQVLMKDFNPKTKFSNKWLGPMVISRVNRNNTYYLCDASKWMIPDPVTQDAYSQFKTWIEVINDRR